MNFVFLPLALLLALAGRVLAFNITVGTTFLNSSQILDFKAGLVPAACTSPCAIAQSNIGQCNDNVVCLCSAGVAMNLQSCQQCMFTEVIRANIIPGDIRIGSTPLMAAYSAKCKDQNITLAANQTALTLPVNWDGPVSSILPVGGAAVAVIAGGFLGISALLLLSNLE